MESPSSLFYVTLYITVSLSVLSLILMNFLLKDKQSNYSKLMKYICLAEAMFIYAEFVIIVTNDKKESMVFRGLNAMLLNL